MGFFDSYKDEGGASYITKEEKAVIAEKGLPITVVRAWFTKDGGYQGKPGYKMVVEFDGEERSMSFGAESVPSRDRLLDELIDYLDVDEEAKPEDWAQPIVSLSKAGQAYLIVAAG